jgi:multicomponent Na+:H+ antiporter subunit C
MEYLLCLVLFGVGIYAVLAKRNIIKIVIGISIMGYALNLLFVLMGNNSGSILTGIPIFKVAGTTPPMVNPLPQALVLTTVIIGLGLTILLSALAIRLYEKYGTLDITEIRKLKG